MDKHQSNKPRHSIAVAGETGGRRLSSFFHLNIPEPNWKGSLTHLHLPSFNITSPDGEHSRKFNFNLGIRRHSHHVINFLKNVLILFVFYLFIHIILIPNLTFRYLSLIMRMPCMSLI